MAHGRLIPLDERRLCIVCGGGGACVRAWVSGGEAEDWGGGASVDLLPSSSFFIGPFFSYS